MKKNWVLVAGVLAAVVLAGCGSNQSKKASQAQTSTTSSTKANSSSQAQSSSSAGRFSNASSATASAVESSASSQTITLWTNKMDQQLEAFINEWAPSVNQNYIKYTGKAPLENEAGKWPADFARRGYVKVNNTDATIGWNPMGKGKYEYNVVALYTDKFHGAGHITYAFAFHNGTPIALVSQTTNGGIIYFNDTKNADVAKNFASIAAGKGIVFKAANSTTAVTTNDDSVTDKQLGIMVAMASSYKSWLNRYIDSFIKYVPASKNDNKSLKGYSVLSADGDATSFFGYKKTGDTVIMKYWMVPAGKTNVDGHFTTQTFSYKQLLQKYYSTSDQRNKVNADVTKLRAANATHFDND